MCETDFAFARFYQTNRCCFDAHAVFDFDRCLQNKSVDSVSRESERDFGSISLAQHCSIPVPCTAHLLAMPAVEVED